MSQDTVKHDTTGQEPDRYQLEWFTCPKCHNDIERIDLGLRCCSCLTAYPIINGIPSFAREGLSSAETEEMDFWERDYHAESDGSFHVFTDDAYRRMVRRMGISPRSFGLDFASGSGAFSRFLKNQAVLGLDISLDLLQCSQGLIPVQGSGMELPFRTGLFDYVVCVAGLHHIPDPRKAIAEISRVLQAGGVIGIVELNTSHPQRSLIARKNTVIRRLFPTTGFSPSEQLIRARDLETWLEESRCRVTDKVYFSPPYQSPSILGKAQQLVSDIFGHGSLKRLIESYVFIRAEKDAQ